MTRARYAALALGALLASPAYAVDVPRPSAPPDKATVDEPHRFTPVTQGIVGGTGGVLVMAGVAIFSDAVNRFSTAESGSAGSSCRPCSSNQVTRIRAEDGTGIALMSAGGVLLAVTAVLAWVDWDYRHQKLQAKVQLTPSGIRF